MNFKLPIYHKLNADEIQSTIIAGITAVLGTIRYTPTTTGLFTCGAAACSIYLGMVVGCNGVAHDKSENIIRAAIGGLAVPTLIYSTHKLYLCM